MKKLDLDEYRRKLTDLRAELQSLAATGDDAASTVELDQTRVGRLSRMDALRAQAMSVEAKRRRENTLVQIATALRRIDAGDYGYCLDCEEPIDERRLDVSPMASLCIRCAELR